VLGRRSNLWPHLTRENLEWQLGPVWNEAYMVWKTAFAAGALPLDCFSQVLMSPSLTCSLNSDTSDDFVFSEMISSAVALMQLLESQPKSKEILDQTKEIASQMSSINMNNLALANPSHDRQSESMLNELFAGQCHGYSMNIAETYALNNLDDGQFKMYLMVYLWLGDSPSSSRSWS
jgi:hypothetical protein